MFNMPRDGQGKWLLLIPAGILLAMAAPSFVSTTKNCGGNTAAVHVCQSYALILSLIVSENSEEAISATNLPASYHDELARIARYHWVPGARFLVNTELVTRETLNSRQIVIVCNTAYRNVPKRRFIKAPSTHAVGYSDGTTALISTADFHMLNKAPFIPLDALYPQPVSPPPTLAVPDSGGIEIKAKVL
jgi:hypothetical protein